MKREKIDFEECVGFGDNNNDIEILSQPGISVAMGNSSEELKKRVDLVTDDINDDGIFKALLRLNLI